MSAARRAKGEAEASPFALGRLGPSGVGDPIKMLV